MAIFSFKKCGEFMDQNKTYTKEEVVKIAKSVLGKTFGEINSYQARLDAYSKGQFGHILEEDVYGYGANSNKDADFKEAGIELKVTPYKKNKNGTLSAKERLVITIINFMEDYKYGFYDSHLYEKSKAMQIIWYLYEEGKKHCDLKITHELLYSYPKEDLPIIINDYQTIIDKIKQGKADEISEADTMYLGACCKGANSSSLRKQPFSDKMAMQRAFCLKTSYMTQLVREYIGGEKVEKIMHSKGSIGVSFEEELINKLTPYYGKTVDELKKEFNITSSAKNINELLLAKMLGIKGKVAKTDEFLKANIIPKTIRIQENGRIIESMSFPTFKFDRIVNEEWEESDLYNTFFSTKYMFSIFKEKNVEYVFSKIMFWHMPLTILNNEIWDVWNKTKKVIQSGKIVKEVLPNGKRSTNFPGMSENKYCHVRPHGKDANDTYPLPVEDRLTGLKEYTKQCFWLNASYISSIIENEGDSYGKK